MGSAVPTGLAGAATVAVAAAAVEGPRVTGVATEGTGSASRGQHIFNEGRNKGGERQAPDSWKMDAQGTQHSVEHTNVPAAKSVPLQAMWGE